MDSKSLPTRPFLYGTLIGPVGEVYEVPPQPAQDRTDGFPAFRRPLIGSEDAQEHPAVPQADGADDFAEEDPRDPEDPERLREEAIAAYEQHLEDRREDRRYGY